MPLIDRRFRLRNHWLSTFVCVVHGAACTESAGPDSAASVEPVVLAAAGNAAECTSDRDEATARLLDDIPGLVAALGDNVHPYGSLAHFTDCYEPTWGRHRSRTLPVLGNHEYEVEHADGFFDYFGQYAGPRGRGYFSIDAGAWHLIVLNDNYDHVSFAAGSEQDQWLVSDLAANRQPCVLAMWHQPRFLSSDTDGFAVRPTRRILWDRLYSAGTDIVLNGHQHHYERMAPMDPDGVRDDAAGIRQFNVGTGGESIQLPTVSIHPNSEVRGAAYGVLELTLRANGYDWDFISAEGESFTDTGTGTCH